jgi:CBS domain-containing protein
MRDDRILFLEDGQPLVFGRQSDRGIRLSREYQPEVVEIGVDAPAEELLVHDAGADSSHLAYLLSRIEHPTLMGVFRDVSRPTYTEGLMGQIEAARGRRGQGDLNQLYRASDLWEIKPSAEVETQFDGKLPAGLDEAYLDRLSSTPPPPGSVEDRLERDQISILRPQAPIMVESHTSIANAIRQMNVHNIGCVLVVDENGQLVGIFTERDVMSRVMFRVEDESHTPVADYMTPRPWALRAEDPIRHALHLMSAHGFRHLPLVDDQDRPEGVISFRDVIRYLKAGMAQE